MEIKSKSIEMVDINSIIPHPKNANRHSTEQIERLQKLIEYQGFRNPLIVSNRTGFLVVGHGRLQAAINLGLEKLPVIHEDFNDEAQEYAYVISDNEIARWAELDKDAVFEALDDIEVPSFDLLGIQDFDIDLSKDSNDEPVDGDMEFSKEVDEKNDYIVLLFDSKEDFKEAKEKLDIKSINVDLSESGKNPNMIISGTGRVIDGKSVITRL